jgi:acid phosphatase
MIRFPPALRVVLIAAVTAITVSAGGWQRAQPQPTDLQRSLLYSDLWMQTSGEYVACCLQTYRIAGDQVGINLKNLQAREVGLPSEQRGKPPAVVMDLDETVVDNSTYQTYLYDSGQDFTVENFTKFVIDEHASIRLVPGAKDFLARMDALGVAVCCITDRTEEARPATIETLAHGGVNTHGMDDVNGVRLIMGHGEHDKVSRRAKVLAKYQVIGLVGDQLGDFSDEFTPKGENLEPRKAVEMRRDAVYAAQGHFGVEWFVLPQPVYGSWQRMLKGDATQFLRRADKQATP